MRLDETLRGEICLVMESKDDMLVVLGGLVFMDEEITNGVAQDRLYIPEGIIETLLDEHQK